MASRSHSSSSESVKTNKEKNVEPNDELVDDRCPKKGMWKIKNKKKTTVFRRVEKDSSYSYEEVPKETVHVASGGTGGGEDGWKKDGCGGGDDKIPVHVIFCPRCKDYIKVDKYEEHVTSHLEDDEQVYLGDDREDEE